MNRMEDVAKLLGVELGERFKIEFENGECIDNYSIREDGLNWRMCNSYTKLLVELLIGTVEVVKQPWTPKEGERYYAPHPTLDLYDDNLWQDDQIDRDYKRNVGVYRTKEEAIAKAKELGWT
jgi:hypothetical protein